jgi:hypothetical protein
MVPNKFFMIAVQRSTLKRINAMLGVIDEKLDAEVIELLRLIILSPIYDLSIDRFLSMSNSSQQSYTGAQEAGFNTYCNIELGPQLEFC